ncbi:MAG: hypothetical protein ACRCXZ_00130 [Patescibacteria group bacterium]
MNKKILAVTLQENESNVYEYNNGKLLFNSTIDNDQTISNEEEDRDNHIYATGKMNKNPANEGNWKESVRKNILKDTFAGLVKLYQKNSIKEFKEMIIFFSSNTSKEVLEEQIEKFQANVHGLTIKTVNKNLIGHEEVLKGVEKNI